MPGERDQGLGQRGGERVIACWPRIRTRRPHRASCFHRSTLPSTAEVAVPAHPAEDTAEARRGAIGPGPGETHRGVFTTKTSQ